MPSNGEASNPNSTVADDDDGSGLEVWPDVFEVGEYERGLLFGGAVVPTAKEDDGWCALVSGNTVQLRLGVWMVTSVG